MENKQLNMEQRKVLKNLFLAKLSAKKSEINAKLKDEMNNMRDTTEKKLQTMKELKDAKEIFNKLSKIGNELLKKEIVIQVNGYDSFMSNVNKNNNANLKLVYRYGQSCKEITDLEKKHSKIREKLTIIEQEGIADIYSLNIEYTALVKVLDDKLAAIM